MNHSRKACDLFTGHATLDLEERRAPSPRKAEFVNHHQHSSLRVVDKKAPRGDMSEFRRSRGFCRLEWRSSIILA